MERADEGACDRRATKQSAAAGVRRGRHATSGSEERTDLVLWRSHDCTRLVLSFDRTSHLAHTKYLHWAIQFLCDQFISSLYLRPSTSRP